MEGFVKRPTGVWDVWEGMEGVDASVLSLSLTGQEVCGAEQGVDYSAAEEAGFCFNKSTCHGRHFTLGVLEQGWNKILHAQKLFGKEVWPPLFWKILRWKAGYSSSI